MFLHLSVILFTGGFVSVQGDLCPGWGGLQGGLCSVLVSVPYGKERTVRILLECILVDHLNS